MEIKQNKTSTYGVGVNGQTIRVNTTFDKKENGFFVGIKVESKLYLAQKGDRN